MRRQLQADNCDVDYLFASSQHFLAGQLVQDMPEIISISSNHVDPKPHGFNPKRGFEPRQYLLSERKLQATAFAGRVHNLRYYIGLIGAKDII